MLKTINIDPALHKKLKLMSAESGLTMSALIEEGLNYILGHTPINEKIRLKNPKTKLDIKPYHPISTGPISPESQKDTPQSSAKPLAKLFDKAIKSGNVDKPFVHKRGEMNIDDYV